MLTGGAVAQAPTERGAPHRLGLQEDCHPINSQSFPPSVWAASQSLIWGNARMQTGTKQGEHNPTTAPGNTEHAWRLISLPQSHADELTNTDWSLSTGRLSVSLHKTRQNANPLPLDNTETQQWHERVLLRCGCTTVASPSGSQSEG